MPKPASPSGYPRPLLMGVLNVTPDSFSDGGKHLAVPDAIDGAAALVAAGVDIVDVGGESTRPGAAPVSLQEELDRVLPVLEALRARFPARLSVDTRKVEVAREAISRGATLVNDVSGGSDIRLAELVAKERADVILMHMQGQPATMQEAPSYPRGVVTEVVEFLQWRARVFEEVGARKDQIWLDPGIGFGKTLAHNLELLRRLDFLVALGHRVVVGLSRKSFLARVLGDPELPFEKRREGHLAACLWSLSKGASVFRVHDPEEVGRALATWRAIAG